MVKTFVGIGRSGPASTALQPVPSSCPAPTAAARTSGATRKVAEGRYFFRPLDFASRERRCIVLSRGDRGSCGSGSRRRLSAEELPLKSSLTIVLPLHNSQSMIADKVQEFFEILPELCSNFEIVLVDDGSTDLTVEVAHELSLRFPQVQLIIHPAKLGAQESLRSALRYSHGEMLLACARPAELDPNELSKLWERRTVDGAVCGSYSDSELAALPKPPVGARPTNRADLPMPDVLLVPRRLLVGWASDDGLPVADYLRRRGYPLRGVAIRSSRRRRQSARRQTQQVVKLAQVSGMAATATLPPSTAPAGARLVGPRNSMPAEEVRRPNFLSKLKAFTWGE